MKYRELIPSPKARRLIKCFWTLESERESGYEVEPIVPDGCPELVFNLSEQFQRLYRDQYEVQPRSILVGQMRSAVTVLPTGRISLFGVRFWPFGLYPVLRESVDRVTETIETAEAVFGSRGARLEAGINEAADTAERVEIIENEFAADFLNAGAVSDETVSALRIIGSNPTEIRIDRLSDVLGVGIKKLERRFKSEIGLTPKFYSRMMRVNRLVGSLSDLDQPNWTDIGYKYGFSDQSHFIREFKSFTGAAPGAYAERQRAISDLFAG